MRLKILREGSLLAGSTFLSILLSLYVIVLLRETGGFAVAGYGIGYSIIFVANRALFGFRPGFLAASAKLDRSHPAFSGVVWTTILAAAATGIILAILTVAGYLAYTHIVDLEENTRLALDSYLSIAIWTLPLLGVGSALSGCLIRLGFVGRLFVISILLLSVQAVAITLGVTLGDEHIAPTAVPALTGLVSAFLAICAYLTVIVRSGTLTVRMPKIDFSRLNAIWINSLSSGADAVVIAVTFMLVAMIGSHLGTQEAAATATIITVLRLAIIPCKSFGVITGRFASAAYAKDRPGEGAIVIRAGIQLVYFIFAPVALILIVFHDALARFLWPDFPGERLDTFSLLLVLAGLQILIEPIAGFLSTILKILNRGMRVLGNTILYQWLLTLPAAYLTAVFFEFGIIALWLCMVCGRLVFAGLSLSAWKANTPAESADGRAVVWK